MKKTKQTFLTALTFTAALQLANTASVNAVTEEEIGSIGVQVPFNAEMQEIQDVYGPAPDYNYPEVTTATIETALNQTTTEIITTYGPPAFRTNTTETTIQSTTETLYGPPRAYFTGDFNNDDSVDVFDLIHLKKMLLNKMKDTSSFGSIAADVNRDGEFNVADLVAMQNYILGRIPDLTTPLETTTTTGLKTDTTTTSTITFKPELTDVYLMYGPPPTTLRTDDIFTTTTTTFAPITDMLQPMYGPPEYFGLDPVDFTSTEADNNK